MQLKILILTIQLSGLVFPSQQLMIYTIISSIKHVWHHYKHADLIVESLVASWGVMYPIAIVLYTTIVNVIGIEGPVDVLKVT